MLWWCNMRSFFIILPFLGILSRPAALQNVNAVAELSNRLGSELHKKLSDGDENVFFSPLSISIALAMLYYGTRGNTADEMGRALGYQQAGLTDDQLHSAFRNLMETLSEDSASKEYMLYSANAVLTQKDYPILEEYKTGLREIYKATAQNVDFRTQQEKAVREINDWVRQKTNNKIDKLLSRIDPSTVMVLLNAVYFKGTWKTKFGETMKGVFFNKGSITEKVMTTMMYYKKDVGYTRVEGAQAIELPYKGEDICMVIVLPDALDGLAKLEQNLSPNTFKDITRSFHKTTVRVTLPKFKLEYKKTLNEALKDLGVKNIFENSADMRGISVDGGLIVSEVVHKAVVDVNEEGTEAAAVTSIGIKFMSAIAAPDIRFVADHPFVFAIIDRRNDLVLFQGRVNKL